MNWTAIISNVVIPAIVGGLAGLLSPWANWFIEKQRQRLQRRQLPKNLCEIPIFFGLFDIDLIRALGTRHQVRFDALSGTVVLCSLRKAMQSTDTRGGQTSRVGPPRMGLWEPPGGPRPAQVAEGWPDTDRLMDHGTGGNQIILT